MSSLHHNGLAGTFGSIQVGADFQVIVLDITGRNYDTYGHLHVDHALVRLPVSVAYRLHTLLGQMIVAAEEAEPRQSALWSNATPAASKVRA